MSEVIDLEGVLISAFVANLFLALLTLALIRWSFGRLNLWRFFWNPPLAQFGLLVCLLGLYTWLL